MPLEGSGSMQLGRLIVAQAASALVEPVGDPIGATGGAVVPAARVPQQYQIALATVVSGASTLLQAQKLRRQLRAMLNNTPLKLQGFIYLVYADDPELNAWLVPDPTTLSSPDPVAGNAVGLWQTPAFNFSLIGHKRTHREARSVWSKPLWTGLYERDQLGWIISSDFNALGSQALTLTVFPHGATQLRNSVTGQVVPGNALPTGRDGGVCTVAVGLSDLAVVSYERPESAFNLSDVVVYDMRGRPTANLFPNPSVEQTASGWVTFPGAGGTIVSSGRVSTDAYVGGACYESQTTGSTGTSIQHYCEGARASVAAGQTIGWRIAGKLVSGSPCTNLQALIRWYNNAGSLISQATVGQGQPNPAAGTWYSFAGTWTAPAGTASVAIGIQYDGTGSGAYTVRVDGAFGLLSVVLPYVDGDMAGYIWSGASGNSVTVGPGEEVTGPDYPWSWLTGGQPQDTPVLDNGLVRVRWDGTNTPGFRVDVWNGSTYVEQGKMTFTRFISSGSTWSVNDTWIASSLMEWTPERAVLQLLLGNSGDSSAMETVFVTVDRGTLGATFEIYAAMQGNNAPADAALVWAPAGTPDVNDSVMKSDTQMQPVLPNSGASVGTAGTGTALWTDQQQVGAASFMSSENYVSLLRFPVASVTPGPYQHNLVVLQGNLTALTSRAGTSFGNPYGQTQNQIAIKSTNGQGYAQVQVNFAATAADQGQQAESIRYASGTTSQITDASASGGLAVKDTQTAMTANTLVAATSLLQAKYRVFARVKADTVARFLAYLGTGSTGAVAVVSSTSWTWVDLGDVLASGANPTLAVNAWGQSTLSVPTIASATPSPGGGSMAGGTRYYKVTAMAGSGETPPSSEVSAVVPTTLSVPTGVTAQWITGGGLSSGRYYKVTALNGAGETIASSEVSAAPPGSVKDGSVFLYWTAVPGASFYRIYVGTTSGGENQYWSIPSSQAYFIDSGTVATTAGSPPGSNTATVSAGSIALMWPAIPGATAYRVYRGTSAGAENVYFVVAGGSSGYLSPPSGLSVAYAGSQGAFATGTNYWKVTALNAFGETTGSLEKSLFVFGGGIVGVSWNAVPGASSYNVYRSTTRGGEATSPALVANTTSTSYYDYGLPTTSGAVPATNTALGNMSFTDTGAAGTSGTPPGVDSTLGAAYIDRVELFLSEDRARAAAIYSGARDQAFAALYDNRQLGTIVAR